MDSFDHILMIGFGGPTKPEEVKPFLEEVTRGLSIPEDRLREVLRHYEKIGCRSPYNEYTMRLVEKIRRALFHKTLVLPVFTGMRNWHPFLKETLSEIKKKGFRKGIGVILAPHRSDASFEKYIRSVEEAKKAVSAEIEYEYLKPWHDHSGFIEAQTEQVRKIYNSLSPKEIAKTHLLFCAHSIPVEMAQKSKYAEEIGISSALVARELGHSNWSIAYQSRSGNPRQTWLEPDVCSAIRGFPEKGIQNVLLVPIGFLCDNAEVLYDLDIDAKQAAEKSGVRYLRASTVMDHPRFASMFAELIQEHLDSYRC